MWHVTSGVKRKGFSKLLITEGAFFAFTFEINLIAIFFSNILKWSHDFLLYTKKEASRVLFYDKIWLLPRALGPCFYILHNQTISCQNKLSKNLVLHFREVQLVLPRSIRNKTSVPVFYGTKPKQTSRISFQPRWTQHRRRPPLFYKSLLVNKTAPQGYNKPHKASNQFVFWFI